MKRSDSGEFVMLIVYNDDIFLSRDDTIKIVILKRKMGDEFEIKDIGNLKYFLGIEVARSREGILVSKRKYTLNLLKEICINRYCPTDTPIEFNVKLESFIDKVSVNKEKYQQLMGKVIYLSHTILNILYAVSIVC